MFTEKFGKFLCDGDKITCRVDGFECVAFTERDDDGSAPDERMDGFWPSRDPKAAGYVLPENFAAQQAQAERVMKAWQTDEWDYCGVCVVIYRKGVCLTDRYSHAVWGIERNYPGADNDYLRETANELLPEALESARAKLTELVK